MSNSSSKSGVLIDKKEEDQSYTVYVNKTQSFEHETERWIYYKVCHKFDPKIVIDVGCYIGDWTRLFTSIFPEANVLMLDANIDHAEKLQKMCDNNPRIQYEITGVGNGITDIGSHDFYVLKKDNKDLVTTGSSFLKE